MPKAKEEITFIACANNPGVMCEDGKCEQCGWNPKIDAKRKREFTQNKKQANSVNVCMRKDCAMSTVDTKCSIIGIRCVDVPTTTCKRLHAAYQQGYVAGNRMRKE